MVERISALHGHYVRGRIGPPRGEPAIVLREVPDLQLQQISAWPDTLDQVATIAAQAAGVDAAPGPGAAATASKSPRRALLRVEPLKWWLIGGQAPEISPQEGATLCLSHSRTHLQITGRQATTLLNRHLPLDLRPTAFPVDTVAASALHHVGVTLWHSRQGWELFIPRGFALSLWEVLVETATQFGAEIA